MDSSNIEQLFFQYNPWWEDGFQVKKIIKREQLLSTLYPLMETPDIIILTGLRRVGKTITMKSLIQYLINKKNITPTHCFYISMDDYQLESYRLIDVINEYRKLMKLSVKDNIIVFFDEITYIDNFQIQLKNIYDKGHVKCIVSSSSSSILKDDSAHLTGRKRIVEINPLDFDEYLQFKNIKVSKADEAILETYFTEYMQIGGMPEYVLRGEREYLVSLIDDIIMKDIVAYHSLKNPTLIREFFILLMERAGKQISLNKIANILKISPDTAKRYLTMFEETYLVHLVSRHGKTNETLLSAKKIYATDVGMRNIIVGFRDKGAIFENIVFMKIKNYRPQYVYVNGQELDFLINGSLLEVKFNTKLIGKQLETFEAFKAEHKYIINGYKGLRQIQTITENLT
jgi:predicted AAA+ superfamily ATPase